VRSAEAGKDEALATYQQAIYNAFRETNDALTGSVKKRIESAAQARRIVALREAARLSRVRFNGGYASYIEPLYAENELFTAELTTVRTFADQYTQIVNVYKAMGGGWVDLADAGTAAGQKTPLADRASTQPLF
jgi:multidrug efflux system outer membrane protein